MDFVSGVFVISYVGIYLICMGILAWYVNHCLPEDEPGNSSNGK